jgi:hypothetical protein
VSTPHGRRPVRKVLKGKRSKVLSESRALTQQLQSSLSAPTSTGATQEVLQLRSTLKALRKEVHSHGTGKHTGTVVGALSDLEQALSRLAIATEGTDINKTQLALSEGIDFLQMAKKGAKAAGADWPL